MKVEKKTAKPKKPKNLYTVQLTDAEAIMLLQVLDFPEWGSQPEKIKTFLGDLYTKLQDEVLSGSWEHVDAWGHYEGTETMVESTSKTDW